MASDRPELEQLSGRAVLREHRFRSDFPWIGPLIAWFRGCWNSVSTKWYVRPLIQQQSEFNQLLVQELAEIRALLEHHEAHLAGLADELRHHEAHLADLTSRLQRPKEALHDRLRDHEAWLIAQDHEQSELVRDLAELRVRLTQLLRSAQVLSQPDTDVEAGCGETGRADQDV